MKKSSTAFFVAAASLAGVSAFAAASGTEISQSNLGNVMYVGDSITHGVNSASYRWALHKIFVDNGISYEGVGYKTGHHSGGVAAGTVYGGVAFSNEHSSQASARAWEISGRKTETRPGQTPRFDKTNIKNWLGIDTVTELGTTYTGSTFDVDTFFLLIGTNDLLSDCKDSATNMSGTATDDLLGADRKSGDMGAIVDAMYKSNADASVTVFSVPCWTTHSNNNGEDVHTAVQNYNTELQSWVSSYNTENGTNVKYVDLNAGILDVASDTPFFGVSSMFNSPGSDGLHPNAQGDLIIAGNIAKALGYAGRTAGQTRKAASEFSVNIENFAETLPNEITTKNTTTTADGRLDFSASGESTLVAAWAADADLSDGFTVDFSLVLGDGETNGWNTTDNLSVTIGSGSLYGTLNINEAYVQWGNTVLYSTDMSALTDSLRVAYVVGNAAEGLSAGFYVWLGDQLIGEALSATRGNGNSGVTFSYSGTGTLLLDGFSMDGSGSYAPTTTLYTNEKDAYVVSPIVIPTAPAQGEITFPTSGFSATAENIDASTSTEKDANNRIIFSARKDADSTSGKDGNSVSVSVAKGDVGYIYANSGKYTGDVWATVEGGSASAWYGAHTSGDLTGDVGLRLTGDCTGGKTVFGAVNAGTVSGNVYLDISAKNAEFGSFTKTTGKEASVVGAYNASVDGTVHVQISAGTFSADVLGGLHTASGNQSIGKTKIFINGGTFNGGVYGGGLAGKVGSEIAAFSAESEATVAVTVTSGTIINGVFGGGKGDVINGNTSVTVTGGVILGGIYGGGSAGTINGNTTVTIEGDIAQLRANESGTWSAISGGGTGGKITGDSAVILKNVSTGNSDNGFDKYAGTISGGTNVEGTSTLILDNVRLDSFGATLTDFDVVSLQNGTATALSSVGGAATLELQSGTSLSLAGAADLSTLNRIVLGENASLTLDFSKLSSEKSLVVVVDSETSKYSLQALNGTADMDLSNVRFLVGDAYYDAVATIPDLQAGAVFIALSIPEPSAFGLLAGVGVLALAASRRRRRNRDESEF